MCLTVRLVLVAYPVDFGLGPDVTFCALAPTWEAHVRTAAHLMEGVIRGKETVPFRAVVAALATHNVMCIWPASWEISGCRWHE